MKFFFLMIISPGSLPIHGIFSPINRSNPMRMIKTPNRMSILPKGPSPIMKTPNTSSNVKNQSSKECQMARCKGLNSFLNFELFHLTFCLISKTFLSRCRCSRNIAGGTVPGTWKPPVPFSILAENLRNKTESPSLERCAPRFP